MSNSFEADLAALIAATRENVTPPVEGFGHAVAGVVDRRHGTLVTSGNLSSWHGQPLARRLADAFHCPVTLLNDAEAAAFGELTARGPRPPDTDFWLLVWGTGLGGCFVRVAAGIPSVEVAEPGHQIILGGGDPCPCGQLGCLEAYVGGRSIARRYGSEAKDLPDHDWADVLGFVAQGIVNLVALRPVDEIVLGGGVAAKQAQRIPQLAAAVNERLRISPAPTLRLSGLGERLGVAGALAMAGKQIPDSVSLNKSLVPSAPPERLEEASSRDRGRPAP